MFDDYDAPQLERIILKTLANGQIYSGFKARGKLRSYLALRVKDIKPDLYEQFLEKTSD